MSDPGAPASVPRVRVFACGERSRGDDAVAILAAERLPAAVRALAEVDLCGQLDVQALVDIPAGQACIVVDAAVGIPPGEIVVLPLEQVAQDGGARPHSSHSLPPDQSLALAAVLRGELPRGSFVGLGGAAFELGAGLSPAVAAAMDAFVQAIAAEIHRLSGVASS